MLSYRDAAIPVRLGWSSPFVRWQGALAELSSLDLAAQVTSRALAQRDVSPEVFSSVVLGWTVPQREIFYGAPTLAARIGAGHTTGPMLSQACATSAAAVELAAMRIDQGADAVTLVVTTDRTSNGPTLTYPRPSAPGGTPEVEQWVLDNFSHDPWAGETMVATAEHVAAVGEMSRQELDEVTLQRYEQYGTALADDRAFQTHWMVQVELPTRKGAPIIIDADQGVTATTAEGLTALQPVTQGGVVTYGTQTHPADGTAGMVVTTAGRARELAEGGPVARILGTGQARAGTALMPMAPVPAAQAALTMAGLDFTDVDAVTMHDPFAVNDVWFSRESGIPHDRINERGASLVFGHPQGPTGARLIVELMNRLVQRGGGVGLFTGCAAGDSGAALVVRVD